MLVGSMVNFTPFSFKRSYSWWTSATPNWTAGSPSAYNFSWYSLPAGWWAGSSNNFVPSGFSGETSVNHRYSPAWISSFLFFGIKPKCFVLVFHQQAHHNNFHRGFLPFPCLRWFIPLFHLMRMKYTSLSVIHVLCILLIQFVLQTCFY